jgi:putative ABC transport system substrate-binding protein
MGTPSAQAVINGTKRIPVVFTAITDPVGTKLANSLDNPGGNKTGYTNMQPFDKEIELIKLIKPDVKKVGIITNSSESNCVAGMVYVRKALEEFKISYEELDASTSSEITACAQSLSNKCDVFFISPSNTIYENLGAIKKEAQKKNIMIVGGDRSAVTKYGSIGTYSYNFVEMGINTAELAIKILDQKLNPGIIPVSRPANTYLYINIGAAKELGLTIPEVLIKNAVKD